MPETTNTREMTEEERELPALSIQQPWAWLIVSGHKDIKNRTWRCNRRGRVLIHAGKQIDRDAEVELRAGFNPCSGFRLGLDLPDQFAVGGIVGIAEIIGCVAASSSPWFCGPWGIRLAGQRPVQFAPCKGALGFFKPAFPALSQREAARG